MKLSDFHPDVRNRLIAANPGISGKAVTAETKAATPGAGAYRSKLEREYGDHLRMLRDARAIADWKYEAVKFCIARGKHRAYFTPDFLVITNDGAAEFHETKGFKREAAMLRLKTAAGDYPFRFILVTKVEGEWKREEF